MQSNRGKDTKPEIALRSALFRAGLRFRKNVRPLPGHRCEVDILFPGSHVAVFLDGCFWHGCPEHETSPAANGEWWKAKLATNRARDVANQLMLESSGWAVVRIWEHESLQSAVHRVLVAVGRPNPQDTITDEG